MATATYQTHDTVSHKARKLAASSSHNTTNRTTRPRRQAAADPSFSYAERTGSLTPELDEHLNSRGSNRVSKMRRASTRTLPSNAGAGSLDAGRAVSPSSLDRRSSTPSDLTSSTPLTKTGRLSRALKGKKVHKCDICDRVYTRNEHLRRHQLNHNAEFLRCPVDGCQKIFSRADLLKRHKEEHSSNDDPSRRRSSLNPHPSPKAPPSLGHPSADPGPFGSWFNDNLGEQPSFSHDNPRHSWAFNPDSYSSEPSPTALPESAMGLPPYAAEGFPMLPLSTVNGPEYLHQGIGSISPVSASPQPPAVMPWQHMQGHGHIPSFSSPTNSEVSGPSAPYHGQTIDMNAVMPSGKTYMEEWDAEEEAMILRDVQGLAASMPSMQGSARLERLEDEYIEAYWQRFDPAFSIVHKPTFEVHGTSPLVRSLMIAIGAQTFDNEAAQTMARTLRESCAKLMQRRPPLDYSRSRLWDLQAVFLHEVFTVFCSRRPSSRFSQRFEDLLTGLLGDRDNLYCAAPMNTVNDYRQSMPAIEEDDLRYRWLELESKRRLLLASYVLETQQNSLFGSHRPVSDFNLPVPCSQVLWTAYTTDDWQIAARHDIPDMRSLGDMLAEAQMTIAPLLGSFVSHVAIAYGAHASFFGPYAPGAAPIYPLSQCAQVQFAYEAAQLACFAPVADLLAVSGETFMLGQKMATLEQFEAAVGDLRTWASSAAAAAAVRHAVQLLRVSFSADRVGLLHEDWSLTLAALTLWAVSMWPAQYTVTEAQRSEAVDHAEEKARAIVFQHSQGIGYSEARVCLAYVRSRIEGRLGWLVQDACGTLGKLVEGRTVDVPAATSPA